MNDKEIIQPHEDVQSSTTLRDGALRASSGRSEEKGERNKSANGKNRADEKAYDNIREAAAFIKEELNEQIVKLPPDRFSPTNRQDSYRNPIALLAASMYRNGLFKAPSLKFINQCHTSSKLIILAQHLPILQAFYEARKIENDCLGNLYKELSFEEFLLRLYQKRYKEIYIDGRAIVGRKEHHHIDFQGAGDEGKKFLYNLGTEKDKDDRYRKYLTLEEMMLSPLILPQSLSPVIGTGSRTYEKAWNTVGEFNNSIDVALFSYPAAAEFRDGFTAHFDLLFIARPINGYNSDQSSMLDRIKGCRAILDAAKEIYGPDFAFNGSNLEEEQEAYLFIESRSGEDFYLNRNAYLNRTKHILKQVLLAANYDMNHYKLGTTFQLKGLGLGAFSFSGDSAIEILENLYLQALKEVLMENSLNYIQCINLINLPTTFGKLKERKIDEFTCNNTKVIRTDMDPTIANNIFVTDTIGATVFCGDSGSQVGNEGNIGLMRNSSDDPATLYSLLYPEIFNHKKNATLKTSDCLFVLSNENQLIPLNKLSSSSELELDYSGKRVYENRLW